MMLFHKHLAMAKILDNRRFWLTALGLVVIVLKVGFNIPVSAQVVTAFSGLIAVLVGTDAYVQGKHVQAAAQATLAEQASASSTPAK